MPTGTSAYFTIDATPAREFANEFGLTIADITAFVSVVHYDEHGTRSESDVIPIEVDLEK